MDWALCRISRTNNTWSGLGITTTHCQEFENWKVKIITILARKNVVVRSNYSDITRRLWTNSHPLSLSLVELIQNWCYLFEMLSLFLRFSGFRQKWKISKWNKTDSFPNSITIQFSKLTIRVLSCFWLYFQSESSSKSIRRIRLNLLTSRSNFTIFSSFFLNTIRKSTTVQMWSNTLTHLMQSSSFKNHFLELVLMNRVFLSQFLLNFHDTRWTLLIISFVKSIMV